MKFTTENSKEFMMTNFCIDDTVIVDDNWVIAPSV